MSRTSMWRQVGCALATTLVVLGGCPLASGAVADDVSIRFNAGKHDVQITAVPNSGTAPTWQRIVTANGGHLVARLSRTGTLAAEYPAFNGSTRGPRAVVAITNKGATDALNPGSARFLFGADVRLDPVSSGTRLDNGNNVIQRGLSPDPAQFKVQIDDGHASCRVKGDLGVLSVEAGVLLRPSTWYRVTCARQVWAAGDHLTLTTAAINLDGTLGPAVTASSAVLPVGSTTFGLRTPLSVGGKLNANLTIASASDQFNGRIDNAFLRIP